MNGMSSEKQWWEGFVFGFVNAISIVVAVLIVGTLTGGITWDR